MMQTRNMENHQKKYYGLLKPRETVDTKPYYQQLTNWICLKKCQNTKRVFFFATMLHHIQQNRFATRWKHSAGKFYPPAVYSPGSFRLTHVCIDVSRTCWAALYGISYEDIQKWFDEWFAAKGKIFTGVSFINTRMMGKMYNKRMCILWINHFLSLYRI